MTNRTTITISDARRRIFDLAEAVQTPGAHYTLTENGLPKVVMMSAEEFESWQETLEVSRIFPNLKEDVAAAERDIASGRYRTYPTLDKVIARWGKGSNGHAVSGTAKAKRRARTR